MQIKLLFLSENYSFFLCVFLSALNIEYALGRMAENFGSETSPVNGGVQLLELTSFRCPVSIWLICLKLNQNHIIKPDIRPKPDSVCYLVGS